MTKRKPAQRVLAAFLACLMLLPFLPVIPIEAAPTVVTVTVDLNEYIVFDLAQGNVSLDVSYSGVGYRDGTWKSISGTHNASNKYYIFQSEDKNNIQVSGNTLTLTYTDIDNALITNKTDVNGVISDWAGAAVGRTPTSNYISITGQRKSYDVTVDNIWTTARDSGDTISGIKVYSKNSQNFNVTLRLKGDNRLEHLFYSNSQTNSSLTITNGAKATDPVGSLTVIADQTTKLRTDATYYKGSLTYNHWDSVIGGYDGTDAVYRLNITGGVIYAGASELENCTAIGGGGNGHGQISISGTSTVVTAVTHSTGTAIGGGIAHTGSGGSGDVTISGGRVYAYNFGVFALDRVPRTNAGYGTDAFSSAVAKSYWDLARHVPGTAIGGAGSIRQTGSKGTVSISGGTVYAESLGGAAIGGGSTVGFAATGAGQGGEADVSISGGTVTALSTGGTLISKRSDNGVSAGQTVVVEPGTGIGGGSSMANVGGYAGVEISGSAVITANGIGGGTSVNKAGGNAAVIIGGGSLQITGIIGGGESAKSNGGTADVTVNGGNIMANGIGGGRSDATGKGGNATVTINGGKFNIIGDIGGGPSKDAAGGNATVTINGGQMIISGVIGGGSSETQSGGTATVKMTDGTIVSMGIGGGFSPVYGYAGGSVTIDGGSLNSSMSATPVNSKGEHLHLTRIAIFRDDVPYANQKVQDLTFYSTVAYKDESIYTDDSAMIHLWLPAGAGVEAAQMAGESDNVLFTPEDEADRIIDASDIGALVYHSDQPRYILTVAGNDSYSLYYDEALTTPFLGAVIVEYGPFYYYLKVEDGSTLVPYVATTDDDGNRVIIAVPEYLEPIGENLYRSSVFVKSNTTVWYQITKADGTYFSLDLSAGDVSIKKHADNSLTIVQNGFTLSNYMGDIYLTSANYPTTNTVQIEAEANATEPLSILVNELNVISKGTALTVNGGKVELFFGDKDNMIHSTAAAPIVVNEGAQLSILTDEEGGLKDSIKLTTSAANTPIIEGAGSLNLSNQGGFMVFGATTGISQIAIGEFSFEGKNNLLTAELYKGKYSYYVIGFMQEGMLHPVTEEPRDDQKFSARGLYEVYNGISSTVSVVNNQLMVVLTVDPGKATVGFYKVTAVLPTGEVRDVTGDVGASLSDDGKTLTLTVPGTALTYGHLTVHAAADNFIPYEVLGGNSYVYDAPVGYSITVKVESFFDVYYSITQPLHAGNYTSGQKAEFVFTEAGSYTVYFYILEKTGAGADPAKDYEPVAGSAELTVTTGTNVWQSRLECPDIVCTNLPAPVAVSKWGSVSYTFYIDNAPVGKAGAEDVRIDGDVAAYFRSVTADANFYVIASVAGMQSGADADRFNYEAIESTPIYFRAMRLDAYATGGRHLDRITDGDAHGHTVKANGAFSIYYKGTSAGSESKLVFRNVTLPAGTKITMILLNGGAADYYYYRLDTAAASPEIPLSAFSQMGDSGSRYQPLDAGAAVEYQFCVEYVGMQVSTATFSVQLNSDEENAPTLVCSIPWDEQLRLLSEGADGRIRVQGKEESIAITVHPEFVGAGYKYMAFRIKGTYTDGAATHPFTLVNTESALAVSVLMDNDTTSKILEPIASSDDFLFFALGAAADQINQEYTLTLSNVKAATYHLEIEVDIRLSAEPIADCYALMGADEGNHESVTVSGVGVTEKRHFSVSAPSSLITDLSQPIRFAVTGEAPAQVSVRLLYKREGVAVEVALPDNCQTLPVQNGSILLPAPSTLSGTVPNGIYYVIFSSGSVSCTCPLIVHVTASS